MTCLNVNDLVASPGGGFRTAPLTFAVERGEILCLVGPSGCGKTTLIRALAGLLAPRAGSVSLDGRTLNDPAIRVDPGARRTGMVFQNLALWPHMRALDQVLFAMPTADRKRAAALLAQVGLAGKERSKPGQLSGGEGQRVALARALAGDPLLLLMDEPLRSVDPHLRADLGAMLRRVVAERKLACILVTHDREEALALGDRIAVMHKGELLGVGTAAELRADPPHPFVASYLQEGGLGAPPTATGDEDPGESAGGRGPGAAARLAILVAVLAGAAGLVSAFSGDLQVIKPLKFSRSGQCKSCHPDVYAEWEESWHAKAWTNPEVRRLSNNFSNKECLGCHAPRPIMETGLGQRVLPRSTNLKEGVNCLSCHLDGAGRVMAVRTNANAPCLPVANPAISSMRLCEPCHNQHGTHDQWRASAAFARGEDCNTCHMTPVERKLADGTRRQGRSHVYRAAHDASYIRTAVKLEVARRERTLVIKVTNVFAGHNFPTDSRHKASDLLVRWQTEEGFGPWRRLARYRQPYREEPGPNTQLKAGETRTYTAAAPAGATAGDVRLDYRATPFVPDTGAVNWDEIRYVTTRQAVILHRTTVELK